MYKVPSFDRWLLSSLDARLCFSLPHQSRDFRIFLSQAGDVRQGDVLVGDKNTKKKKKGQEKSFHSSVVQLNGLKPFPIAS